MKSENHKSLYEQSLKDLEAENEKTRPERENNYRTEMKEKTTLIKQNRRERWLADKKSNTKVCEDFVKSILDITEEAYMK